MKSTFIALILFLPLSFSLALTDTEEVTSHFVFTPDSEIKEVLIPISEADTILTISVNAELSDGAMTIEIFRPDGSLVSQQSIVHKNAKRSANTARTVSSSSSGGGSSKSNISHKDGKAIGEIEKMIQAPQVGQWLIKITPFNTTADIELNY